MLEGDLGDFSLPDILKLLAFTSKSGRLTIATTGARGRIDLAEGRILDASSDTGRLAVARRLIGRGHLDAGTLRVLLSGRSALPTDLEFAHDLVAHERLSADEVAEAMHEHTVDAVFDLFRWPEGSFSFASRGQAERPAAPLDVATAVDELVAEVETRLDVWDKVVERSGPDDAVVMLSRPGDAGSDVGAQGWQLVGLVDGRRTVIELARLSGRGEYATRLALAELIDRDVLAVSVADEEGGRGGVERLLADQALLAVLENDLKPRAPSPAPEPVPGASGSAPIAPEPATPGSGSATPARDPAIGELHVSTPPQPTPTDGPGRGRLVTRVADDPSRADGADTADTPVDWGDAVRPTDRLRPDPGITEDLVRRLIEGVERI